MKIIATFDESLFSEAIIPVLRMLSALPGAEIDLRSVAEVTAAFDEHAIDRRRHELEAYLTVIARRLPDGAAYRITTDVAMFPMDVAAVLIEHAESEHPDLIVMATHGRSGIPHVLLGSVAAKVLQAGVAPVLLVRPRQDG